VQKNWKINYCLRLLHNESFVKKYYTMKKILSSQKVLSGISPSISINPITF